MRDCQCTTLKNPAKDMQSFIRCEDSKESEYISDNLSLKQADKWCDRLNSAYNKGVTSQY